MARYYFLPLAGRGSALALAWVARRALAACLRSARPSTPAMVSSLATASVGWAPLASQADAFSVSISTRDGSLLGWYAPRFSRKRPGDGASGRQRPGRRGPSWRPCASGGSSRPWCGVLRSRGGPPVPGGLPFPVVVPVGGAGTRAG